MLGWTRSVRQRGHPPPYTKHRQSFVAPIDLLPDGLKPRRDFKSKKWTLLSLATHLGDPRKAECTWRRRLKALSEGEQGKLVRICALRLQGKARSVALYRLKARRQAYGRFFTTIRIPTTGSFRLRAYVIQLLRQFKQFLGPCIIQFRTYAARSISSLLTNQKKWDKAIADF